MLNYGHIYLPTIMLKLYQHNSPPPSPTPLPLATQYKVTMKDVSLI